MEELVIPEKIHNPDNKCFQLYKEVEYNPDALQEMFNMQNSLQNFYGKQRGLVTPSDDDMKTKILESLYYWNASCAEYFELIERLERNNWNIDNEEERVEIWYEVIDIWHFIMNQFLYLGLTDFKEYSLSDMFDSSESQSRYTSEAVPLWWSEINFTWGKIVNDIPFKKWKSYKNYKINPQDIKDSAINIIHSFVGLCNELGIDEEIFYNLYVTKNQENANRQAVGGIYSKEK